MYRGQRIKIWGTRGSFPAPAPDRMIYGGNTLCISIELENRILVLDAGSGLAELGRQIMEERRYRRIDLFLSHLHLDHIIGMFNFQPFFDPEMEIHIYGETKNGRPLDETLGTFVGPPWWPMGFSDFSASVFWHEVTAGADYREKDGIQFSTLRANHPNDGLLYRFKVGRRSLMYGLDCEMDESIWNSLVSFSRNCSLLICDGQFEEWELDEKKGWGHSSWEKAVRLRKESGAGKVLVIHYGWDCTDKLLKEREAAARDADEHCIFAKEGMEVEL